MLITEFISWRGFYSFEFFFIYEKFFTMNYFWWIKRYFGIGKNISLVDQMFGNTLVVSYDIPYFLEQKPPSNRSRSLDEKIINRSYHQIEAVVWMKQW